MRPIDADAIPYTMLYKENWIKGTGREEQGVWKSEIDKMPTIEQKRGLWEWHGRQYPSGTDWMCCSECDWRTVYSPANMTNYCPNCGAKMVSEDDQDIVIADKAYAEYKANPKTYTLSEIIEMNDPCEDGE